MSTFYTPAVRKRDVEHVKAVWLSHGFDNAMWPHVTGQSLELAQMRAGHTHPGILLNLETLLDKTVPGKDVLAWFPDKVVKLVMEAWPIVTNCGWCFADEHDWWKGDKSFLVHDFETYAKARWYMAAIEWINEDLRDWKPKSTGKVKVKNELWADWLEHRARGKAEVEAATMEWKDAYERAEELRLRLAVLKAEKLLTYEQFKAQQ